MPNIIQNLYEEKIIILKNLKTDKDEDRGIINDLFKMIHCLSMMFIIILLIRIF